ncbi:choice-of-anchor I family protein [Psychrobacillus sp. FSL H8-0484]|uniref:choice-of-anchor I family protein n=1 Tax=Psychrobacillus sp. FSL H8-0484 TaxID=2921390 RepID=UPI0030F6A5F8
MKESIKLRQKTYKAALATTLAAGTLVAAVPSSIDVAEAQGISFTDVKENHHFYESVKDLTTRGIISGYEDGTFKPGENISRAHAAKIISLALGLDTKNVKDPGFKDVSKNNPYFGHIAALVDAGIIKGYEDQTFKPNGNLTRAHIAQMLVVGFDLEEEKLSNLPFKDINDKQWFANYIQTLYKYEITTGKTATTFEPNATVTRGQVASFINRAEAATKQQAVEVIDISKNGLTLSTGTYAVNTSLQNIFNESNLAVLKGAKVKYTVKNNEITEVSSIEIKASGTANSNLILDGKGSNFAGNLTVNGDFVSVKNLTINNDLIIGNTVKNSFLGDAITVIGKTIISDNAVAKNNYIASLTPVAAIAPSATVFNNSKLGTVELSKTGSIFEAKGTTSAKTINVGSNVEIKADKTITLPEVKLLAGATQVTINANVSKLNVDSKGTKLTLGSGTKVGNINLPAGTGAKDVIQGYDKVKANIENINGKPNPDAKPVTPPSNGGGNNGNNPPPKPNDENFNLSIMHVNDIHANTDKAPKLVTAVKEVRTVKPDALLLNAGDVFSGTLYFNEFLGKADLEFMNLMKVDAMTFGNHEFDLGSSAEGHKALVDFIEAAQFPFVSANVDFSKDDKFTGLFNTKIPTTPEKGNIYTGIVKEVNGEKVGIFGLTTAETKDIASPGEITFSNYIEDAEKMVAEFEAMGINKIVALTHIGFDDNAAMDNDQELAAKVDGIDVIVGGHSHTQLNAPVVVDKDKSGKAKDKTIIVQAYQYSDYLGTLDVEFDKNGVVVKHAGKLIKTADKAEDADAVKLLKPYKDQIKAVNEKEIGVTLDNALLSPRTTDVGYVPGTSVRASETILGNLITDGMLTKAQEYVKDKNVIMAFQNGGGIRAGIGAGPITVGEVITVLPFGNTLATMEVTGAELKEAFEISVSQYPKENGGFLHVSGAKVEFDSSKKGRIVDNKGVITQEGERVVSISYKSGDGSYTEIDLEDDETKYTIATNAFTAKGGDGYKVLGDAYTEGRVTDLGLSDWENLKDHLIAVKNDIPTEIEGRIVDVKAPTEPVIVEDPGTTPEPVPTTAPPLYNSNPEKLAVSQIARYDSGQGETGTEILAYDVESNKGFVTNGAVGGFDILTFADLKSGEFKQVDSTKRVVIEDYGIPGVKNITSIASHPTADLIAIAAYGEKTDPGYIVFATKDGKYVKHVKVGALPDMVTFTPDGTKAIVANEGEPNKNTTIDPKGSISVIDVASLTATPLNFTEAMLDENVRASYKGASILEQLEPEYVTVSEDSKTAYVTLQENNAIATVDLVNNEILHVKGLGVIDHSIEGNEMDANKDDKKADILKQPILTFHMPDAVDTFTVADKTYIITPNEGDSRDYADDGGYSEVSDLGKLKLPISLKAANYKNYTQEELDAFDITTLAGYKVTTENGLNAAGTAYEAIYGYGGRSFSIFDAATMEQVFDSGSEFEQIIAEKTPQYFNTSSDAIKVDNRSDDKGPEPETAVVGEVDGKMYAFIALERYSGIMVYDLTNVAAPEFVTLISSRDFSLDAAGDVSPEGLQFIPASESPTGKALLAATHEVSGTVAVYEFGDGAVDIPAENFSGTVDAPKVYEGNVTVSVTDAEKLEHAVIKGNLILTGTPKDTISITNIVVKGNVDLSGLNGKDFNFNGLNVDGETIL